EADHLEGNQALIVVHGKYAIEFPRGSRSEKAIGREGALHEPALILEFDHDRADHLFFFFSYKPAIACVRIESQHSDPGFHHAEVADQRLLLQCNLWLKALAFEHGCHLRLRDVYGDKPYSNGFAHNQHEAVSYSDVLRD